MIFLADKVTFTPIRYIYSVSLQNLLIMTILAIILIIVFWKEILTGFIAFFGVVTAAIGAVFATIANSPSMEKYVPILPCRSSKIQKNAYKVYFLPN